MTQAVATDPAMLIWLDADSNKASHPNENFARELMERFTMGIGSYTQDDVSAASFCFTGWSVDRRTGVFAFYGPTMRPAPDVPREDRRQLRLAGHRHRHSKCGFQPLRSLRLLEHPGLPGDTPDP